MGNWESLNVLILTFNFSILYNFPLFSYIHYSFTLLIFSGTSFPPNPVRILKRKYIYTYKGPDKYYKIQFSTCNYMIYQKFKGKKYTETFLTTIRKLSCRSPKSKTTIYGSFLLQGFANRVGSVSLQVHNHVGTVCVATSCRRDKTQGAPTLMSHDRFSEMLQKKDIYGDSQTKYTYNLYTR